MGIFKAVFFDADGTLVDHKECEKQALEHLFENIGLIYKNEYQDVFRPLDNELWYSGSYNGVPILRKDVPVYRFKLFFDMLDIVYDDYVKANDLFKTGLANSIALMDNAVEIIEYLFGKGYMLCVVTNGLIELQRPRVTNSKIGKFISHVIVSEEVGAPKPNPLIFQTLLNRMFLSANEVIMIGDSLKNDIQGSKNAGIKAVWFNPEQMKNDTGIVPDYEINNLLQMKQII